MAFDLVAVDLGRALTSKFGAGIAPIKRKSGHYEVMLAGKPATGIMIAACADGTYDCFVRVPGEENEFVSNGNIDTAAADAVGVINARAA